MPENETVAVVVSGEEVNFLDESTNKIILGLFKSPFVKMFLNKAKSKSAGVKVKTVHTDSAGVHFTLHDEKMQKERKVIITTGDLEKYIRLAME